MISGLIDQIMRFCGATVLLLTESVEFLNFFQIRHIYIHINYSQNQSYPIMKTTPILLFIVLLFTFCGSEEQTDNNVVNGTSEPKYEANFTSESGMFKCYFPESFVPEETYKQLEGEDGIIELHSFQYKTEDFYFAVKYADYPKQAMEKYTPQEMMTNVTKGPIIKQGYKITKEETNLVFDGCPSQVYMWEEYNPETTTTIYIYKKDMFFLNRLYSLVLMRKNGYPTNEDIKMYIETFKLTK
jgi:hypothetical protein